MIILIIKDKGDDSFSIFRITNNHIQSIKNIVPKAEIVVVDDDKKIIDTYINTVEIIINSSGDLENIDIEKAKNLRWIHSTNAGVNGLATSLKHTNIILTNSSGVHPIPIAEHVFAMILFLTRKINKAFKNQLTAKKWRQSADYFDVEELFGKKIAIIGYGHIGKRIGEIAQAFGMKVLTQRSKDDSIHLQNILQNADFIVDCLPLTQQTQGFFDNTKFKLMKSGSYFINIGRGQSVVENDLIDALKKNLIEGAGLDVFEHEPLDRSSELWDLPNVIITTHYAGYNPHYYDRMIEIFNKNLQAFLDKTPLPNLVDKNKGY